MHFMSLLLYTSLYFCYLCYLSACYFRPAIGKDDEDAILILLRR